MGFVSIRGGGEYLGVFLLQNHLQFIWVRGGQSAGDWSLLRLISPLSPSALLWMDCLCPSLPQSRMLILTPKCWYLGVDSLGSNWVMRVGAVGRGFIPLRRGWKDQRSFHHVKEQPEKMARLRHLTLLAPRCQTSSLHNREE